MAVLSENSRPKSRFAFPPSRQAPKRLAWVNVPSCRFAPTPHCNTQAPTFTACEFFAGGGLAGSGTEPGRCQASAPFWPMTSTRPRPAPFAPTIPRRLADPRRRLGGDAGSGSRRARPVLGVVAVSGRQPGGRARRAEGPALGRLLGLLEADAGFGRRRPRPAHHRAGERRRPADLGRGAGLRRCVRGHGRGGLYGRRAGNRRRAVAAAVAPAPVHHRHAGRRGAAPARPRPTLPFLAPDLRLGAPARSGEGELGLVAAGRSAAPQPRPGDRSGS
jgi:hypothetical protein